MKIHPQIISYGKNQSLAVLPYSEFEMLLEALEDVADIEVVASQQLNQSEKFPLDLIENIARGENPIKAYRQYRKPTQETLAKKAKVSKQYIPQLELGSRKGSLKILKSIAKILSIDLDDIS